MSTLRNLGGLGGGHESMRSTLDESPDIEEFEMTTAGHSRHKSIMKNYSQHASKPPVSTAKKLSFSVLKPQPIKSSTKATTSFSHARSISTLSQTRSVRASERGCVSIGKSPKRAVDEDFWEDSK